MARILGIGIATLDILNYVDRYPVEDEELRARAQQIRRGGNVSNSLVVLSSLGHRCALGGTLALDAHSERIVADLRENGVDTSRCRHIASGRSPVSCIVVSAATGSRTIVHYRDLPEFSAQDFSRLDVGAFDWLHFEGRNVGETARMLIDAARRGFERDCMSVEVEKPRDDIEQLLRVPGLVIISRAFAQARGMTEPEAALHWARAYAPDADLVCAWGDQGAWCEPRGGGPIHAPAVPVPQPVETIGAGDTFNAGLLDARLRGLDWNAALTFANRLAARKCAQHGFAGLGRPGGPAAD